MLFFIGGAAYLINNNLQIDATNFKDTPTVLYGGIGFSWRYRWLLQKCESIQAAVIMQIKSKKN
jgi:hypothetical protein